MKKFILAAAAASMVATPAFAASRHHDDHGQQHRVVKQTTHRTVVRRAPTRTVVVNRTVRRAPTVRYRTPSYQYRHWQRGQRFDSRYARNYRQIDYRQYRGLRAPPPGYRWVRSDNDAVLVSLASGLIGAVIGGAVFN